MLLMLLICLHGQFPQAQDQKELQIKVDTLMALLAPELRVHVEDVSYPQIQKRLHQLARDPQLVDARYLDEKGRELVTLVKIDESDAYVHDWVLAIHESTWLEKDELGVFVYPILVNLDGTGQTHYLVLSYRQPR